MSAVESIKSEIQKLTVFERGEIVRWLHGWLDDDWDRQMARDAAAGKLDVVLKEVDEEIDRSGST